MSIQIVRPSDADAELYYPATEINKILDASALDLREDGAEMEIAWAGSALVVRDRLLIQITVQATFGKESHWAAIATPAEQEEMEMAWKCITFESLADVEEALI